MAAREAVAIMKFDDRNRYGQHGIPATVLFGGGKRWIVNCKRPTKHNQWAKVKLPADDDAQYADLVDILGDVGDHAVELLAMQLHFRVKPCRYPPRAGWGLTDAMAAAAGRVVLHQICQPAHRRTGGRLVAVCCFNGLWWLQTSQGDARGI